MYKKWLENCKVYMSSAIFNAKDTNKRSVIEKYAGMIIAAVDQIMKIITDSRNVMQALQKSKTMADTKVAAGITDYNDLANGGGIYDNTIGSFLGTLFGGVFDTNTETEDGESLDQSTISTRYDDLDSLPQQQQDVIDDIVVEKFLENESDSNVEDALTLGFGFGSAVRKMKKKITFAPKKPSNNAAMKKKIKPTKKKTVISLFSRNYRKYLDDFKEEGLSDRPKISLYDDNSALTAINAIKTTYEMTESVFTTDQLTSRDKQRAKEISASVFENMVKKFSDTHKAYGDFVIANAPNNKWVNDDAEHNKVQEGFKRQETAILKLLKNTMAVIQGIQISNEVISGAKIKIDLSSLSQLVELGKTIKGIVSTDQLDTAGERFNNEIAAFFQIVGGKYDRGIAGDVEVDQNLKTFDEFFNSSDPVFGDPARSIRLPFRALDCKHHTRLLKTIGQIASSSFMFDDLIQKINAIYAIVGTDLFKSQNKFDMAGFINIANELLESCSTMPIINPGDRFFIQNDDGIIQSSAVQRDRRCSGYNSDNGTCILVTNDYNPQGAEALAYRDELINIQRIVLRSILAAAMQPLGILLRHLETSVPIVKMYGAFASGGSIEDEVYSQLVRFDKIVVENVYLYAIASYFVKFYSNVLIDYNNTSQDAYSFAYRNHDLPMLKLMEIIIRTAIDGNAAAVDPSFKNRVQIAAIAPADIDRIVIQVNKWVSKNKITINDKNREAISESFAADLRTTARRHLILVNNTNIDKYRDYLNKTIGAAELTDFNGDFRMNELVPTYDYSELPESVLQTTKAIEKKVVATFDPKSMTKIGSLIDSFVRAIPRFLVRGLDEKIKAAFMQIGLATTDAKRRDYLEQFINGTIRTVNGKLSENYSMIVDLIKVYIEQTLTLSVVTYSLTDYFLVDPLIIFTLEQPIAAPFNATYLAAMNVVPIPLADPNIALANQFCQMHFSRNLFSNPKLKQIYHPMVNSCNRFLTPMILSSEIATTQTDLQLTLNGITKTGLTSSNKFNATSLMSVRLDNDTIGDYPNLIGAYDSLVRSAIPRSRVMLDVVSLLASLSMHGVINYKMLKTVNRPDDISNFVIQPYRLIEVEEKNLIQLLENSYNLTTSLSDVVAPNLTTKGNDMLRGDNFGLEHLRKEIKKLKDKSLSSILSRILNAVNVNNGFMTSRSPCIIKPETVVGSAAANHYIFSAPRLITQPDITGNNAYIEETKYPFVIGMISMCYDDLDTESCASFLKEFTASWIDPKAEQNLFNDHPDNLYDKFKQIVEKGAIGNMKTEQVTSRTLFETTYPRGLFYRLNRSLLSLVLSGIDAGTNHLY